MFAGARTACNDAPILAPHCTWPSKNAVRFFISFHQRSHIVFKRVLALLLTASFLAGLSITLAACNTIAGAGEDISRGGDKIRDEANEKR
jgi:predicted small secreted protein